MYRELASRLKTAGWLEWHFLKVDNRVCAAHMAVRFPQALCVFKVGYDETLRKYSPGNVLMEAVLQREFELQVSEERVEFLTKFQVA